MTAIRAIAATTAAAIVLLGCSSTRFLSTWQEPSAETPSLVGEKVAMFNLTSEASTRRIAEDLLAREIGARGVETVSGYTLLPGEEARDSERARKVLAETDCDYVLLLRAVDRELDPRYVHQRSWWHSPVVTYPLRARGPYWGPYWSSGWTTVILSDDWATDSIYTVETLVYSLEQEKLVWAGLSETVNPGSLEVFLRDYASAVDDELRKSGLLR